MRVMIVAGDSIQAKELVAVAQSLRDHGHATTEFQLGVLGEIPERKEITQAVIDSDFLLVGATHQSLARQAITTAQEEWIFIALYASEPGSHKNPALIPFRDSFDLVFAPDEANATDLYPISKVRNMDSIVAEMEKLWKGPPLWRRLLTRFFHIRLRR